MALGSNNNVKIFLNAFYRNLSKANELQFIFTKMISTYYKDPQIQ